MAKFEVVNQNQDGTVEPTYYVRAVTGDEADGLISLKISEDYSFEDCNYLASLRVNTSGKLCLVLHTSVSSEYPVETDSDDSIVVEKE
jgi:hypothetical protein